MYVGERIEPDYASDSSDEETINVIGNVPLAWYDDHDHIGYDIRGNKIMRPVAGDMLDSFLEQLDSPDAWRTIVNAVEGKKIVLSDEDLDIIKRIQAHRFPQASYNEHEPTVEWFTSKTEIFPLSGAPEPKSRFIPSKVEAAKIIKIARKIQKGYIKLGQKKSDAQMAEETITDVWENEGTAIDHPMHVPAPKMRLPEHRESYNPPVEYIPTPQEKEELRKLDPRDRPAFLPKKYDTFRSIPMYDRLLQERFARCLDLYMCPRSIKQRVRMDPEDLLPKLPSRKDLEPYPTKLSIVFRGHTNRIRALSVDPTGKWIVSGSDDNTVRCWEIATGRCSKVWKFDSKVVSVAWNPNSQVSLVAVVSDTTIHLVYPEVGSDAAEAATEAIFKAPAAVSSSSEWRVQNGGDTACQIEVGQVVSKVSWHRRGDYFLSISSDSSSKSSVQIHQLSKRSSQRPFSKPIGLVQSALFHPSKPNLFVATQQGVRVYDLVQQKLVSKLQPGVQWISSMDIHPQGDNLIIGSYDKKVCWFDLDLSLRPYKTLRYHKSAVRNVSFHRKYPLFASCSDDGSVNVFHGMVYSSLDQNPLIVPLKSIKAHDVSEHLGVLFCEFHPTQPWLFSAGLSGEHHDVHLYV
ncbi:NUC169 domain-containing protein [Zopfochytrium polystomum]|nr:NUC169 domain-containing protein [Zopfochytrium polystomum]